jgi:hypothetical protein
MLCIPARRITLNASGPTPRSRSSRHPRGNICEWSSAIYAGNCCPTAQPSTAFLHAYEKSLFLSLPPVTLAIFIFFYFHVIVKKMSSRPYEGLLRAWGV